ncbi:MAG TPA: caspase family protein [Syntrophorhabdaceae bacterium]|nr:caspase family protein [Syntrophorhabdaceae bacterium]
MKKQIPLISFILLLFPLMVLAGKGQFKVNVLPLPPNLTATVSFSEPSGNNILDAEETGKLIITVQNTGKGDGFDVKADITLDRAIKGLYIPATVTIGTIPAGKTIRQEIPVRASEALPTGDVRVNIDIKEANGFDPDPLRIAFKTKAFEPPKLVVADVGIYDQNKNSRIEPMEIVEVTARIQNIGHGTAKGVSVDIETGKNVFIAGDSITHFDLGNIPGGRFKDIKFMFYTNNKIKNGEKIPITIRINEERPQFSIAHATGFVMDAPQRRTHEIVIKGEDAPRADIALATGLSVDVDMKIPEGKKAGPFDVAVIIGNKNYKAVPGVPDVEYADRDARIMKEYLQRTFGFKPENIIYTEDATFAKFNEIFGSERNPRGRLYNFIKENVSEVFIYYVGHGAPDIDTKDAYFVPVDANPQFITTNGYRLETFYNNLSKLPAKRITVVLDACFSGNSGKGLIFKNISPLVLQVKKDIKTPANAVIMTSAAMDQVSTWYPEKRHSLFTYYFLKGIQGDADANKDSIITVHEMKTYLNEHVPYMARRLNSIEQKPVVTGDDKAVLVRLAR